MLLTCRTSPRVSAGFHRPDFFWESSIPFWFGFVVTIFKKSNTGAHNKNKNINLERALKIKNQKLTSTMLLIMNDDFSSHDNNSKRVVTNAKRVEDWRNSPRIEDPLSSGDEEIFSDYSVHSLPTRGSSMDLYSSKTNNSQQNNSREWMSQEFATLPPDDTIQPSIFDEATIGEENEHDDDDVGKENTEENLNTDASLHHHHLHHHHHNHHVSADAATAEPNHPFNMAYIETPPPPGHVDLFEPTHVPCVPAHVRAMAAVPRTPDLVGYRPTIPHAHQTRLAPGQKLVASVVPPPLPHPTTTANSALSPIRSPSEPENVHAQLQMLEKFKKLTEHQKTAEATGRKTASPPHHNKKAADPPQHWIRESEITDKDVICERGGKSNRHAGTKRYRGMIEKFKKEYQQLTAKADKTNLSRKLISQIQQNGGRFLKKDDDTNQYFVLSVVETTKKVSQALREKKVLKWTET